jgi:tetratricopeptide (TPR) repeat protein
VAGRVEEATREYQRAIDLEPRVGPPYIGLGDVYARTGHLEQAVAAYERGLARMPEHARGHANLGLALVRLGRWDEARPQLERALELAQQEDRSAEVTLDEAATPHIALGDVLAHQGELDGAIEHYRRAIEIEPGRRRARVNLGIALVHSTRYAEALPVLEESLRAEPDSPQIESALGMSCRGLGREADALVHYRRAYTLEPTLASRTDLAWLLATSPDPAVRDPEAAIRLAELAPGEGEAPIGMLDALAAAYAASGRFAEAVAAAERAEDLAVHRDRVPLAKLIRQRRDLYAAGQTYVAERVAAKSGG